MKSSASISGCSANNTLMTGLSVASMVTNGGEWRGTGLIECESVVVEEGCRGVNL